MLRGHSTAWSQRRDCVVYLMRRGHNNVVASVALVAFLRVFPLPLAPGPEVYFMLRGHNDCELHFMLSWHNEAASNSTQCYVVVMT